MSYTRDDAGVMTRLTPKLLDQVRGRLRLRHYSLRTEQAYVGWIRRFILANGKRHPAQMGQAEVEAFLTDLATRGQVSAGTQNQALAALLFLYREVLGVELPWMENLVRAKRPRRIPVVLSVEEVARLLTMLEGACRLMAGLLYGSGMRLLECLRLRIKDVDMVRCEVVVRDGKGGKDRRVPLPRSLRGELMQQRERAMLLHAADLAEGAGRVSCRMRWRASIPLPMSSPAGSICSPPRVDRWIRAVAELVGITYRRRSSSVRYRRHGAVRGSTSRRPATPCGMRSPRICWRPATISALCRSCWATRTWQPCRSTRMCSGAERRRCAARWMGCISAVGEVAANKSSDQNDCPAARRARPVPGVGIPPYAPVPSAVLPPDGCSLSFVSGSKKPPHAGFAVRHREGRPFHRPMPGYDEDR